MVLEIKHYTVANEGDRINSLCRKRKDFNTKSYRESLAQLIIFVIPNWADWQ